MGIADMNGDGLDDIVRLKNTNQLQILFQPTSGPVFSNLEFGSLPGTMWSMCIADVDGNGFNDVLTGGAYNGVHLYKAANGGLTYEDTVFIDPPLFLQGSNFVDIDGDLDLDVFACHDDALSVPYENDGNANFEANYDLIMAETDLPSDNSGNYGSIWTDYDNDGDLDLYLSKCRLGVSNPNDPRRINQLFQNDGNGNYTNVAFDAGLVPLGQSWATDFADIDNDGDLDCFIINHDILSNLMLNNGDGTFSDITTQSGLANQLSTVGDALQVKFEDFDNDGFVDLFLTSFSGDHCLFLNNGDQTFDKFPNPFVGVNQPIHSAVIGDLNNDGFVDVYAGYGESLNSIGDVPDQLYFNDGNDNHFFQVLLHGNISNANGIGARVELYGPWGIQIREVRSGESYGIKNSFINHFGLGSATSIDSLVIRWPSGLIDRFNNPDIDNTLQIQEGDACTTDANFSFGSDELMVQFNDTSVPGATNWIWEFGDGNVSTEENPLHTYDQPGIYEVCLTAGGFCQVDQVCKTVNVNCSAIQSLFTVDVVGQQAFFTDLSLNEPDEWFWTFGDGSTSEEQSPTHTYMEPGQYFVCLQTNSLCGSDQFCEVITVGCTEPEADFAFQANELMVDFTDASANGVENWFWTFGNGQTSELQNPNITYAQPGTYEVCLTVTDDCGDDVTCSLVTVGCPAPQADFGYVVNVLSVAFQNLTPEAEDYLWDFGDGNTSNSVNPLHMYEQEGTYEVCYTAINICGSTTYCETISLDCVGPQSNFTFQKDELIVSFTDNSTNGPANWSWDMGDGVVINLQNPTHSYQAPGTYDVCLTTTNACGADTTCQTVIVTCTPPFAEYSFIDNELDVSFTDNSTNGPVSWFWTFGDGTSSTQQSPNHTYAEPGTYEVCLTSSSICGSSSVCEMLTFSCAAPMAQFDYQVEDFLSVNFTDLTVDTVTNYNWIFGDGNSSSEANPSHTYETPGTYAVCLEVSTICGSTQNCQLIEVDCAAPEPGFEFISNQLTYAFIDQSTNSPMSWLWDFGDGSISIEQNPVYTYSDAGTYEVCLTANSVCGMETICQTLEVLCFPPDADFETQSNGLQVTFTDLTTNSPNDWNWTFGDGQSSSEQNPTIVYDSPGAYLVCLSANSNCGQDQHCQQVEVSCAAPVSGFSFSENELTLSFVDDSQNGPEEWLWTFGDGGSSMEQNPSYTFSAPGTYEICLTATSICGSNQFCESVTVNCTVPQAAFSWQADELDYEFADQSSGNAESWLWTFGDGNSSTQASPMYSYSAPGTYTVCLTSANICGETTECETIEVDCTAPQANFTINQNGLDIIIIDNSTGNPTNWSWTFGDGGISDLIEPTYTFDSPGSYTICLEVSNICGSTQSCENLVVDCAAPVATFAANANELEIQFEDNSQNSPTEWFWDFGDGNTSTAANPLHEYAAPGTYEVCLTTSSVCGEDQTCTTIEVDCTAPQAAFDNMNNQLTVQFEDVSSNNPTSWSWNFGDENTSMEANPEHTYESPGSYTVCLEVSSICGSTTFCEDIIVSCSAPQSDFDFDADELSITFEDVSMNSPSNWFWTFGDGSNSNEQNPTHTYEQPGNYLVCLQVNNICGSTQRCELIEVNCNPLATAFESEASELEVQFTDVSDEEIEQWLWDFGDGNSSIMQNPVHEYDMPGTYDVCLTTFSLCGDSTFCQSLTVSCAAPVAGFGIQQDGNQVSLDDQSINQPSAWLWDFGDGNTSTEQDPQHVYASVGNYEICLIASSVCGADTSCQQVDVLVADQITAKSEVSIYPNPTNGYLRVHTGQNIGSRIVLWNALGKQVHTAMTQQEVVVLDLSHLPKGTYWIAIESGKDRHYEKIIKLK